METFTQRCEVIIFICTLLPLCCLSSPFSGETHENLFTSKCNILLKNFAKFTSNFTFCAINYSRPIKLCERCVNEYLEVVDAHSKILQVKDESGRKCKEKLINLDRLEVIDSAYQYVSTLWSNGNCDSCFVKLNGSLTSQLSDSTVKFERVHTKTHECLLHHYLAENGTFDKNVCSDCKQVYCEMNDYYDSLKKNQKTTVCVDIVDTMNITRSFWSERLGCDKKNQSVDMVLLYLFSLMTIIPVIFYTSLRVLVRKAEHKLLARKQVAESSSGPSTSVAEM